MAFVPLSRTWHSLKGKGVLFPINLAIALFLVWLVFPYFHYRSSQPDVFGRYSVRLLILLLAITATITFYAYFAVIGSKRVNRALLLMLIGVFVLAEVTTRLVIRSPRIHGRQDAEPRPYVEFVNKPNTIFSAYEFLFVSPENAPNEYSTTNEMGFRGAVPPLPKTGEYRIIVLGGSTAFAGFPLSNSIAGQLESLFHKEGRNDVRVYNWGVPAYISGQELSLLTHTVLDYDPDVVIVYDGANDIYYPYFGDPRPDYPYLFMEQEARLYGIYSGTSGLPSSAYLLGKSRFLTWALTFVPNSRVDPPLDLSVIEALRQKTAYGGDLWKTSIAESYIANHRRMCAVANGGRFKLVTVLQPTLAFKNPWVGNEQTLWNASPQLLQYFRDQYDHIQRGLTETSSAHPSCYNLDLRSIFANYNQEVFVDALHITNEGNTEVANQIYAEMKKHGIGG